MSMHPHEPKPPDWLPPSGSRVTVGEGLDEGRIGRSWRLIKAARDFLRGQPGMLVLPAVGAACTAVATAAIFLPVLFAARHLGGRWPVLVASAACAVPVNMVGTYFNVAFLLAVDAGLRGDPITIRAALRTAAGRWRPIVGWSLLSSLIGLAMQALEQLPGGGWAGKLVGILGGLAWSLATFFVVPVLALGEARPIRAVRQSAKVFRTTWGEAVSADLGIGAATGLVYIPLFACGFAGVHAWPHHHTAAAVLLAIAVLGIASLAALTSALTELFVYALYREATEGASIGLSTGNRLPEALVSRKRSWWRRG